MRVREYEREAARLQLHHLRPPLRQPPLPIGVIGENPHDHAPDLRPMVVLEDMGELVDEHLVDDGGHSTALRPSGC